MFKPDLERQRNQIKLPTYVGSSNKRESSRKNNYFCFIDYTKAFDSVGHKKLWKIFKEIGVPDYLTCLLRNLYASQEATVRTGHRTTYWLQIRKEVFQGCILSPCLFNLYVEDSMGNIGMDVVQARIKISGEISSIISDIQMTPPLRQKQRGTVEPLDESERGE